VVLFRSAVCVVEGGNLVDVVRANVARWSKGGELTAVDAA